MGDSYNLTISKETKLSSSNIKTFTLLMLINANKVSVF